MHSAHSKNGFNIFRIIEINFSYGEKRKTTQDNRILAELEHPRTTGPSSTATGISSSSSILPSSLLTSYSTAGASVSLTNAMNSLGITSSTSNHGLNHGLTNLDSTLSGLTSAAGAAAAANINMGNLSLGGTTSTGLYASVTQPAAKFMRDEKMCGFDSDPTLPMRAPAANSHQISSTMPPICQV